MRGRILFFVGLAAGYVIGARAGRPAYDAVVDRVKGVTGDERVQHTVETAKEKLEDAAPNLADIAEKAASTTAEAVSAAKEAGDHAETASNPTPSGSAS